MGTGQILHRFTAKDGRAVILRPLRWEDLDDLYELINSLIEEDADIYLEQGRYTTVTREEEADWLSHQLVAIEKGEMLYIVAEVKGHVIARADLERQKGLQSHVAEIGVIIKEGYRGIGIGTELLQVVISCAREMGLRLLFLTVFSTNTVAQHLYESMGFRECGRIPQKIFKKGRFIDEIIMIYVIDTGTMENSLI